MSRAHRIRLRLVSLAVVVSSVLVATPAVAQITARARPAPIPAWGKGILPVNAESYYNAIECGKQGGDGSPCVFWDTGLCANSEFTLTWYTGYKQVAYEVWLAVRKKQPPPKPNYQAAQRQRVTIAVAPAKSSGNTLKEFVVSRGGKPAVAFERSLAAGGGRFTFDYPAFAPTADVTLEMVGAQKTVSCRIPRAVLLQLR